VAAYYNEINPYAAEWLRNLIKAGHIAPGEVDGRSIADVKVDELASFTQCHFFAGIGVWSHALRSAGWTDDRPVWTGSCPCQPFSGAGKRLGFADERHLWPVWFRLISERRPSVIFGEQVASADALAWLDAVQIDLEAAEYAVGALDLCAASVGAPHIRQRLWWVADSDSSGQRWSRPNVSGRGHIDAPHGDQSGRRGPFGGLGDPIGLRLEGGDDAGAPQGAAREPRTRGYWADADWLPCIDGKARPVEPGAFPLAHGATARMGRLRAYGNAIVAPVAAEVIRAYLETRP